MIWVAKNLYFFNCLLDGAHTKASAKNKIKNKAAKNKSHSEKYSPK